MADCICIDKNEMVAGWAHFLYILRQFFYGMTTLDADSGGGGTFNVFYEITTKELL